VRGSAVAGRVVELPFRRKAALGIATS